MRPVKRMRQIYGKATSTPNPSVKSRGLVWGRRLQLGQPLLYVSGIVANGMQRPANGPNDVCRSAQSNPHVGRVLSATPAGHAQFFPLSPHQQALQVDPHPHTALQ